VEIRDNAIFRNPTSGIGIKTDAKNIVVQGNRIYGNRGAGVDNKTEETIDARDNWWGDASGPADPEGNPKGKGQKVSGKVDYKPWRKEKQ